LQARRQEILTEIAGLRRQRELPTVLLTPSKVQAFTRALRTRLLGNRDFAKEYLHLLVDVIRLDGDTVTVTGSHAALAGLALDENLGTHHRVPRFVPNWLPDLGSNQGPAD
jgi:site-specific DNA recombinase